MNNFCYKYNKIICIINCLMLFIFCLIMLYFPIGFGSIDIILLPYMLFFWVVVGGNIIGFFITIFNFIKNKKSFLSSYIEQIKKDKCLISFLILCTLIFFIGILFVVFDYDYIINLFYKIRCLYGRGTESDCFN